MSQVRHSEQTTAVIANGATVSGAVAIGGHATGGFAIPAAFTGTAITFQGSHDNTTFTQVFTAANVAVSITVAVSRAYPLPSEVMAFRWMKLVSGTAEGAERTIAISLKG